MDTGSVFGLVFFDFLLGCPLLLWAAFSEIKYYVLSFFKIEVILVRALEVLFPLAVHPHDLLAPILFLLVFDFKSWLVFEVLLSDLPSAGHDRALDAMQCLRFV